MGVYVGCLFVIASYPPLQHIGVGYHMAEAKRITYVGELGWELHIPVEVLPLTYPPSSHAKTKNAQCTRAWD